MKHKINAFKVLLLILAVASFAFSAYLHAPYPPDRKPLLNNWGFLYTDVVYGVFIPRFLDVVGSAGVVDSGKIQQYWYNQDAIRSLIFGKFVCPVPYKDYKFEYPPLVAAFWLLSTCTAFWYTYTYIKAPSNALEYVDVVKSYVMPLHFAIQSAIIAIFYVLMAIYLYRLSMTINMSRVRILLLFILPSTLLYLVYNWDVIAATLTVMSLYYLTRECKTCVAFSGALIGLATSAKVLPATIALVLIYDLLQKSFRDGRYRKKLYEYIAGFVSSGALPYIVIAIISMKGFSDFVNHHLTWYCENCIYMVLINDVFSPVHRVLYLISIVIALLLIMIIEVDSSEKLYKVSFLTIAAGTTLNYVFSPQMLLMVSPLAVIVLSDSLLKSYIIADVANALIMILWFKDAETRSLLAKVLNIPIKYSPQTIDSPVQWFAFVRNFILLLIIVSMLGEELKLEKRGKV